MKISGIVIWYNPSEENLLNIKTYMEYTEKLYIIDNSKENNKDFLRKIDSKKIEYIPNNENLGIAKALNIGCQKAVEEGYGWILTMDQDSSFSRKEIENYLKCFKYIKNSKIGIISPNHILKNDIQKYDNNKTYIKTNCVMTSGNFLNLSIWNSIGRFDEKLFIDEVDSEYCYRILKKNYKLVQLNKVKIYHELGNLEKRKFFNKKISVLNHNYIRKYYIVRNKCYILKKYKKYRMKYIYYILNDFFKVIFYEKDKVRKLKYMFKGMKDFYNGKMGKINEKK